MCVGGGGGSGIRLAGILLHVGADSKKYLVKTNLGRKMGERGLLGSESSALVCFELLLIAIQFSRKI